jgi:hypothetical protein|tara:strand:+ start:624 stop:1274 length:651 start_codon:yes stop_codon:yes gene_type:complete
MKLTRIEKLLLKCSEIMTDWELRFCASLQAQLEKGKSLSQKQVSVFQKVEGRLHSEIGGYATWITSWDKLKAKRWKIALGYYEKDGVYFQSYVVKSKQDPEWIPSESEFKKLTQNKFASRVIAEMEKELVFQSGACVQLRANAGIAEIGQSNNNMMQISYNMLRSISREGLLMFVVEALDVVSSAAKGAREYKVLPAGWSNTLIVQERYLKKAKKV